MIERLRISELVVFASWVVFVIAGLAFQRMTEGTPFTTVAATQPAVGWAYVVIVGGAVASLLAIAVGGIPLALAIGRAALQRRRWRQVGLLAVPPLALAVWVAVTAILVARVDPPRGDPWRVIVFVAWVGVFVLAALASTVAVSAAALDAEVDGSLYRRAAMPAVIASIAMAGVTVAVLAWGVALVITTPRAFWGSDGILGTSTPLTWLLVVVVMAGSAVVAVRSALRSRGDLTGGSTGA